MRRIVIATIGLVSLVASVSLYQFSRPAKAQVSVDTSALNPAVVNNNPIPILKSNKDANIKTFKLPDAKSVVALLDPEAQSHVTDTKLFLFGDYEKTAGVKYYETSEERQVWQLTRAYTGADKFTDKAGTYLGNITVTNIIDAETGSILNQNVAYTKGELKDWGRTKDLPVVTAPSPQQQ